MKSFAAKHIVLLLALAGGIITLTIYNSLEIANFSLTVTFTCLGALAGASIGMMIKEQLEKAESKRKKIQYEDDVRRAQLYIQCLKNGYTSFDNPVAMKKIKLYARSINSYSSYNQSDVETQKDFNTSKALAESIGKEFYTHVQQKTHDKSPSRHSILLAKRPIDKDIDDDVILELYQIGEKAVKTVDYLKNEEEEEKRILDEFVHLTGREKRIAILSKEATELEALVSQDTTSNRNYGHQKEKDWAIRGGIASAIGGAGAGIAVAVDTQIKNTEIRAQNAKRELAMKPLNDFLDNLHFERKERLKHLRQQIEEAKCKLMGDKGNDELMPLLSTNCESIAITPTGSVRIKAKIALNTATPIYVCEEQIKGTIDGVIRAKLMENGTCKGTAYLTLPTYGVPSHHGHTVTGICTTTNNMNANYQVEFEPYHLWLIEY